MAASLCPSADDAMDVSRPVPLEGGTVSRPPFASVQLVPASFVSQIAAGCVDDSRRWVTPQAATVPPVADEVRGTVLPGHSQPRRPPHQCPASTRLPGIHRSRPRWTCPPCSTSNYCGRAPKGSCPPGQRPAAWCPHRWHTGPWAATEPSTAFFTAG